MKKEDETIISSSPLGKRLSKIGKSGGFGLFFGGKTFPITTKITIGRMPDNDVVVDDGMTSRHHATIQKIKEAYFITDLGSSNGTTINGKKVPKGKYVKIEAEDVIMVGRTELKIILK